MRILIALLSLCLAACSTPGRVASPALVPPTSVATPYTLFGGELPAYWYEGKAELSTYRLQQARYGELRDGQAVLIQVTEDFLTDEQVKNDAYENPNSTPVLKTNLIRRFTTGLYDYSVMSSVFTPTDGTTQPRTLKVTTSSQDWCGQSFTQLNYRGEEHYAMQLRSYFEREGDVDELLTSDFLEDEVFNRIRIGGDLPTGTFRVIPPTGYLLMTHQPYRAYAAQASTDDLQDGTRSYTLDYPELQRQFTVTFDAAAPYIIRGWTETYPSRGELLTTTATLEAQTKQAYWQLNARKDAPLRSELNLH
ncbi:hypothetical protein LEM8419_02627 [Neolewinella maritima]|uniref:Septum formation inhibitor Maf n=1 Tax=Neolewinella maritima TaxID=1383882 RepID=A0ABM9B3C1_9BACT|nr:hypothetical protein [Neolewinella maritima]CAH1001721.1 hypothetical protein LEM8419_02627 [Neolewinella maritima]